MAVQLQSPVLRTPDDRFADLPDFPFTPHYVEIADPDVGVIRQHYLDEGPRDGVRILLLHGEPSWSYLYRKVIPGLVSRGYRAIAPDLIGFGRSDKPTDPALYTYRRHVAWMASFIEATRIAPVHLFCQDWGGLIGLRLAAEKPDLFLSVCAANTGLPDGRRLSPFVHVWRLFARLTPVLPVGQIVSQLTTCGLSPDERRAYDAPFPSETYKTAARRFPQLIPVSPEDEGARDNRKALAALGHINTPLLTVFGADDPVATGTWDRMLQEAAAGARGRQHRVIAKAGHMIQEDAGPLLAEILDAFIRGGNGSPLTTG